MHYYPNICSFELDIFNDFFFSQVRKNTKKNKHNLQIR